MFIHFPGMILIISQMFSAIIGFIFICPRGSISFVQAFFLISLFFSDSCAQPNVFPYLTLEENHMNHIFVFFDLQMHYYFIRRTYTFLNFDFSNVIFL